MMKILTLTLFTSWNVGAIIACALLVWPAPHLAADTTGEIPRSPIINSAGVYLLDMGIILEDYALEDAACLTENMYHEARSDGYAGMYATTMVVMNRVNDWRYPDTICEVVKEGPIKESWKTAQHKQLLEEDRVFYPVRNKCQFSWYCDGRADTMHDETSLYVAKEIAHLVLSNYYETDVIVDITEGATHYHATSVMPYWVGSRDMAMVTQIGSHIFYRWD
jgi:hypothetical protein